MKKKSENNGIIKIEKNIPIKDKRGRRKGEFSYPFKDMNVGDSFFVPFNGKKMDSVRTSLHTTARLWALGHNNGRKFSTSIVEEKDGVRIWRTA